jgi:L-ascorbate metabolism protein UlaG (beta-lactamase superfamily)
MLKLALSLFLAAAAGMAPQGGTVRAGKPGEARIWYLGHCGYAVRTDSHLLIFDYQERRDGPTLKVKPGAPSLGNGWISPEEIRDLKVRVFVSHAHTDHFDPVILGWRGSVPDIEYFFGWEEPGVSGVHVLAGPRARLSRGGLEIATINSHHSGVPEVAWLIKVDGLVLYHNGDCQPAEPGPENDFLAVGASCLDVAFVFPFLDDSRYGLQTRDLFRKIPPRAAFPMHVAAGDARYLDFARACAERIPSLAVGVPMRMGQEFLYRRGSPALADPLTER